MRAGDLCLSQPGCGLCAARQRDHDLRGWMPYAGPVTRQRYLDAAAGHGVSEPAIEAGG